MTKIFPTSRCIREFYASFLDTNQLLPKALSIAEFESMSIVVPNRALVDEDSRVLLLKEAANFENFSKLKIDREFLSFLKNSDFLFKFFEELALGFVSIEELKSFDTYLEYEEHLEILKELLSRYKKLLDEKNLYDKINLSEVYELNEEFLNSHEGFWLYLEGFLNRFELELFKKIAKIKPFKISFKVDDWSKKLISIFDEFGLEVGYEYEIDLSLGEVIKKEKLKKVLPKIEVASFSTRTLQASFVYESIAEFVSEGVEPDNIVVITPDESFSEVLREFDRFKNLNFAMGRSFCEEEVYKKLSAVEKFLKDDEIEHEYRLNRLKVDKNLISEIKQRWTTRLKPSEAIEILKKFEDRKNRDFAEELYSFEVLLNRLDLMPLREIFRLFLNRLAKRSIDDVSGGKVTVMGLLESRGVRFDGVIVVDFSDEFVPKRSSKDMFLNSNLRSLAGLPSSKDRQDLQRYYYNSLIRGAKRVAISYVQNEQSMASRFLDELGLRKSKKVDEKSYMRLLFEQNSPKNRYEQEWIEHPLSLKVLSASKLKTLLTCKRKFYFRYVLQTKEAKLPSKNLTLQDMGNLLHEGLKKVFLELKFIDEKLVLERLREYLHQSCKDVSDRYLVDVWVKKLESFAKNEAKRFEDGYRVFGLEKALHIEYEGFKLEGVVDRIDIRDNKLTIIDYKSGKIPKTTSKTLDKQSDFQLEFYYHLLKNNKEIEGLYYYDLNSGELVGESMFEEKLQRLDEVLKSLKEPLNGYEMCEDVANCKYCSYTKLCGREK